MIDLFDNFVIWGPMKLVSGSNKSLGTYRFDDISTVALGQVLQIEMLNDNNPGGKC